MSDKTKATQAFTDEQITEHVLRNLDGFEGYNWLSFVNRAVEIDDLANIAACDWSDEATRSKALDCGCIGITLAAAFRVGFGTSYHAIAAAFEASTARDFGRRVFRTDCKARSARSFIRGFGRQCQ